MDESQIRRHAAQSLTAEILHNAKPEIAGWLASTLTRLADPDLRQGLLLALNHIDDQRSLDQIWTAWAETRHPELERLLKDSGQPASHPASLWAFSRLKLGMTDELTAADAGRVPILLRAAGDPDQEISARATQVIQNLRDPRAREELCRWAIDYDHPSARQAAVKGKYAPADPLRRALFYLLTEQWELYRALDFDSSLLRAILQSAGPSLRARVADLARQTGWAGYAQAVSGGRNSRQLSELNDTEWNVIVTLLGRYQRWEEAWSLAQNAPPLWSARLLQTLHNSNWSPKETNDRAEFIRLVESAQKCLEMSPPLEWLPQDPRWLRGHRGKITSLAFDPNSSDLATGSADRSVRLWHLEIEQDPAISTAHTGHILSLAYSPKGGMLASGSTDRTVRLWQSGALNLLHTLGSFAGEVPALAFDPDGSMLASGDQSTVRLWDPKQGTLLKTSPPLEHPVLSLAFSPDGAFFAGRLKDHTLQIWHPSGEWFRSLFERVSCWSCYPAGEQVNLVTGSSYGQLRRWAVETGEILNTYVGRIDGKHLAISKSTHRIAASHRGVIRVWDGSENQPRIEWEAHKEPITALSFSPDGSLLASAGADKSLKFWKAAEGVLVHQVQDHAKPIDAITFHPAGGWVACSSWDQACAWRLLHLGRIFRTPVAQPGLDADALWQAGQVDLAPTERAWLEFTQELYHWRRRFDIEIDESPRYISFGEFDIELGG